jgi:tRNA G46 methylase TrmB
MNSSESSGSEGDVLNPEYANVFNVGSYFIDLGQYQSESTATGWALASDPASQPRSVCIADTSIFKSFSKHNEAEFEHYPFQDFVLLLKFPGKQQFLLYDVKQWELLTIRYGRLPLHLQQNTLQQLVDKCLRIVQYCISKSSCHTVNNFILLNKNVSIQKRENAMCKHFLSRSVYDGGNLSKLKAMVELKSTWIVDEKATPQTLYKSLFESSHLECNLHTNTKHFQDFTSVKGFEDITEGLSFVCPSKVPVALAYRVLTQMHDRKWKLSPPTCERSQVILDTLLCDIDSGIFYLVATPHSETLTDVILRVKSVLTNEIQKSQVPYVPGGHLHGLAQEKPTIEPAETGVFVKMPDPEHMTEVAKSWLWIKQIPPEFCSSVQTVMCDVAKEILRMSVLGSDQISSNILDLKHSRIATNIPGGLLMVFSTFLILSNTYPGLKLVVETYNNKSKGLISKVAVSTPLDFQKTADEMQRLMFENNSIFRVISEFCTSCKSKLDESASTISFGFRTVHKDSVTSTNVHSCIKKPEDFVRSQKCQIYPMAFMHHDICPFLYHPNQRGEIIRVQMYQEPWSAHKNFHPKQSRNAIGQNIDKAMNGQLLNISALRSGLNDLVESWDASFQNWHDTSGTRFEVACRPTLCRPSESSTMFDLKAGLSTVWQYLDASFSFSPIAAVTTYSSVCTAAILIGYRASLDALKDCSNLEANQQCQLVDYMRYLNAIIHTIPSGRFISNNPKLFLANLGLDSGRCLALVPTLPLRVQQHILSYLPGLHFNFEDPRLPVEHSRNAVIERIEMLKQSDSLEDSMVLCSCGMGFFGFDRVSKLHGHLSRYPSHNSQTYKGKRITGDQWFATYVNQKQHLEEWLSNHGTIEQQSLFQNVLNCKHTCSVGKAGTGKTFVMKKVDDFLSMIFLNPGEIVRIAPLGRVAQFFHCEARTVHSTMRLHMDIRTWTDNDVVSYLEKINSDVFSRMKVLIGLEMFVMCDCVLSGLLTYIRKHYPETLLLFEGDPIQLSVGKGNPVLCDPIFDEMFDTVVFDTQQRITNSEQKTALDMMRLGQADESVWIYWSSRVKDKVDGSCFTIYALKDNAEKHNEYMLQQHETKWKVKRIQKVASDQFNGREASFPEHVRRNCIVEQVLSIVPHAPVFFTRNINAMALCNSKEIYVGNGTPATVTRVEPSFIVVQLECGNEVKVEPIPIDIEGSEGYTRTQYPLILGWASTIHKVQGMQFAKVQINFCLKGNNIKKEAVSPFYRGMAYMAFSRSEHITIIGQICLELLNNVNHYALQYWNRKVSEWSNRNSKNKKLVYRDAIHAHNDFCAQSFEEIRQLKQKNKRCKSTSPLVLNASCDVILNCVIQPYSAAAPVLTSAHAAEVAATSAFDGIDTPSPAPAPANLQDSDADICIDDAPVPEPEAETKAKAAAEAEAKNHAAAIHSETHAVRPAAPPARASVPAKRPAAASGAPSASASASAPASAAKRQDALTKHPAKERNSAAHVIASAISKPILPTRFTNLFISPSSTIASAPAPSVNNHKHQSLSPNLCCRPSVSLATVPSATSTTLATIRVAPAPASQSATTSLSSLSSVTTVDAESAPAPDSAPALASVISLALAATASKPDLADTHAPAQHNVVMRANHSDSVSQAWKHHNYYLLVETLWKETYDQLFPKLGQKTWEEGMKFREGSRGYGEASINVCLLMLEVLDDLYPMQLRKTSPPFFVDIGSGLGNIVLQMSALQPDLKCCFGIELERPRAAFAMEACRVFTANASEKDVRFCQIQAQEGNCFEDACCKQALMSAGIVWINNEVFSPDDNLKVFQFLNSLVPVHCIVMSFVELLVTKRSSKTTPQSDQPSDFVVHTPRQLKNACSWFHPGVSKEIFIIQRKTANIALAKNDKEISSR